MPTVSGMLINPCAPLKLHHRDEGVTRPVGEDSFPWPLVPVTRPSPAQILLDRQGQRRQETHLRMFSAVCILKSKMRTEPVFTEEDPSSSTSSAPDGRQLLFAFVGIWSTFILISPVSKSVCDGCTGAVAWTPNSIAMSRGKPFNYRTLCVSDC